MAMDDVFQCDGVKAAPGGAYQGHMLPGWLFVIWSLHWLQGSLRQYLSCKAAGQPYESLPHYGLPGIPPWPLEGLVKFAMSFLGAILEVTWHDDGYQYLVCQPGTSRAGHFDGDSINNWQHLQMYVCFMVSGLVDVAGYFGILPPGTEKAFLALAFAGETVLMGLHEKEEPLDRFIHQVLALAMLVSFLGCAAEAHWPHSYLATFARITAVMTQGAQFIIIAKIRYEYKAAWDISDGDQAPFVYSKVMFVQTMVTIISCYAAIHIAAQSLHTWIRGRAYQVASL